MSKYFSADAINTTLIMDESCEIEQLKAEIRAKSEENLELRRKLARINELAISAMEDLAEFRARITAKENSILSIAGKEGQ